MSPQENIRCSQCELATGRIEYTDSTGIDHSRCLNCLPDKERKMAFGSPEYTILNDIVGIIKQLHPELLGNHDVSFVPGDSRRPDLRYDIPSGFICFEIDEDGHSSGKYAQKDKKKSSDFKEYARSIGKKYHEIRIVVNQNNKEHGIVKGGAQRAAPIRKIDVNYSSVLELAIRKFEEIYKSPTKKNTQYMKIDKKDEAEFAKQIKSLAATNIDKKDKKDKANSEVCSAYKKDGVKCSVSAKNNGCCGRHQKK